MGVFDGQKRKKVILEWLSIVRRLILVPSVVTPSSQKKRDKDKERKKDKKEKKKKREKHHSQDPQGAAPIPLLAHPPGPPSYKQYPPT